MRYMIKIRKNGRWGWLSDTFTWTSDKLKAAIVDNKRRGFYFLGFAWQDDDQICDKGGYRFVEASGERLGLE